MTAEVPQRPRRRLQRRRWCSDAFVSHSDQRNIKELRYLSEDVKGGGVVFEDEAKSDRK